MGPHPGLFFALPFPLPPLHGACFPVSMGPTPCSFFFLHPCFSPSFFFTLTELGPFSPSFLPVLGQAVSPMWALNHRDPSAHFGFSKKEPPDFYVLFLPLCEERFDLPLLNFSKDINPPRPPPMSPTLFLTPPQSLPLLSVSFRPPGWLQPPLVVPLHDPLS